MKLKENKGASNAVVVMLVVFIAFLICLLVFLLKNSIKEKVAVQNPAPVTQVNSSSEVKQTETKTTAMTADAKYEIYLKNLKNNLLKMKDAGESPDGENKVDKFLLFDGEGSTLENNKIGNLIIEYNGDAYLNFTGTGTLSKKYGEKYKINSDIVNAGFQLHGQDSTVMIWLINDKGEFLYVDISQFGTNSLELKQDKNLKNIIGVSAMYNGESNIPVAIDIEGNIFEIK